MSIQNDTHLINIHRQFISHSLRYWPSHISFITVFNRKWWYYL